MFSVQGLGFSVQCEAVEIVANGRVRSQAMRQVKLLGGGVKGVVVGLIRRCLPVTIGSNNCWAYCSRRS